MTILVTGATGLVGRHVVGQLVQAGELVRALTRNPANAGLPEGVEVFQGDLLDPADDLDSAPIHEADIATVAVAALLEDKHVGKAYTLSGPEQLTVRGQVQAIADALGKKVRYEEVTREEARDILKAMGGFAAESADLQLGFVDYDGGEGSGDDGYSDQDYSDLMKPLPGFGLATGKTGRTYAEWARDHVEDFR